MFKTEGAKKFFAAWDELRTGQSIPHYRAIFQGLPSEIIPRLMMLEEAPGGSYIVRFIGTYFVDMWGADVTGLDHWTLIPPKAAAAGRKNVRAALDQPCGLRNIGVYMMPSGYDVAIESLDLPVANDPGKPLRILGFGEEIESPKYSSKLIEVIERKWVDLGFGLPKARPAR